MVAFLFGVRVLGDCQLEAKCGLKESWGSTKCCKYKIYAIHIALRMAMSD
jgi:hypothetical protein